MVVRVRPMDQREKLEGAYDCVSVDGVNDTISVARTNMSPPDPPRVYGYDAVFDSNTSQVSKERGMIFYSILHTPHKRKTRAIKINALDYLSLHWEQIILFYFS